jgi:hypothetical protein
MVFTGIAGVIGIFTAILWGVMARSWGYNGIYWDMNKQLDMNFGVRVNMV